MVAIQLTDGCNGGCYFCLFGIKRGVTHKFTYESIERFLKKYGYILGTDNHTLALYWDSDPFDYQDGEKNFNDIYALAARHVPHHSVITNQLVSTALPRGGQEQFVNFIKSRVEANIFLGSPLPRVRISISKHNVHRVETSLEVVVELLKASLSRDQFSKAEEILAQMISVVVRDEAAIQTLGPLIDKADKFTSLGSISCADGFVLSPANPRNIAVVAATPFCPSGQIDIPLDISRPVTIQFNHASWADANVSRVSGHLRQKEISRIKQIVEKGAFFLPPIQVATEQGKRQIGPEVFKRGEVELITVQISRQCRSLHQFLKLCSEMTADEVETSLRESFFAKVQQLWPTKKTELIALINQLRKNQINEEIEYLIELLLLLIAKIDFVLETARVYDPLLAANMAKVVNQVGERQAEFMEEITSSVIELLSTSFAQTLLQNQELSDILDEILRLVESVKPKMADNDSVALLKNTFDLISGFSIFDEGFRDSVRQMMASSDYESSPIPRVKPILDRLIINASTFFHNYLKIEISRRISSYWEEEMIDDKWSMQLIKAVSMNVLNEFKKQNHLL